MADRRCLEEAQRACMPGNAHSRQVLDSCTRAWLMNLANDHSSWMCSHDVSSSFPLMNAFSPFPTFQIRKTLGLWYTRLSRCWDIRE